MPGFSTRAIRAASRVPAAPQPPVNVPIYQTSTFEVGSAEELAELLEFRPRGHSYTRYSNPTLAALEDALAELEGGESAVVTASGMAAVHAVCLATLRSGDELLIPRAVYGGTVGLGSAVLEPSGIRTRSVDTTDPHGVAEAIGPDTKLVWLETISNRSEEHTSELQSPCNLVCRLLLEKKKNTSEPKSHWNLVCSHMLEKKQKSKR